MNQIIRKARYFLTCEDGPTATEYAVMLALIMMVCLTAVGALGVKVSTMFANAESQLNPGTAGAY